MHDYLGCIKAVDESVGRLLKYLDDEGSGEQHDRRLLVRPGLLSRRARLVRQALDFRGIAAHAAACPLAGRDEAGLDGRAHGHQPRFRRDVSRRGRPAGRRRRCRAAASCRSSAAETPADWRKSFYYHYYEHPGPHNVARHYGVVTDRYKLVHFYEPDMNYWELFDCQKDPHELKSVYGDPAYAAVQKELMAELARLRTELKVPDPDPAVTQPKKRPGAK